MGPDSQKYEERLRVITLYDEDKNEYFSIITNNLSFSAQELAEMYRKRWEIEILFKWLKQNLKIKTFLGRSENAIKTQIWIALIVYILLSEMFQENKGKYSSLLEYIIYFRERMLIPDKKIILRARPPPK